MTAVPAMSPSAPPRAPAYVLPLALATDLAEAGGKAGRLAAALGAGLPVPPGFVVGARAFEEAIRGAVRDRLRSLVEDVHLQGPQAAPAAAREAERLIASIPLPSGLAAEVTAAYAALAAASGESAPAVAVRSSARAEDGARASLAGCFESELDVRGPDAVLAAVRRCWASGFAERALLARTRLEPLLRPGEPGGASPRHGGPPPDTGMAVLVQRMARGVGGVLFTRDPLTGESALVVEVAAGGAEVVAQGSGGATARLVVDPGTGRVREGAAEVRALGIGAPEALARGLADLARRAEAALGAPGTAGAPPGGAAGAGLDIEWSRTPDGRLHLLQARPITACPDRSPRMDLWTAANSQEAIEDPVTPLTYTFLEPWIERGRRQAFAALGVDAPMLGAYMRRFDGRIYFNVDTFRRFLQAIPAAPPEIFDLLIFGEEGEIAFRLPPLEWWTLAVAWTAFRAWEGAIRRLERFIALLGRRLPLLGRQDLRALPDDGLLRHLGHLSRLAERALVHHVLGTAMAGGHYLLLQKLLAHSGLPLAKSAADELLAGAPGIETARSNAAIFDLAQTAAAQPAVREALLTQDATAVDRALAEGRLDPDGPFSRALAAFLVAFGHRAEKEAELSQPRWREDRTFLLRAVRRWLEMGVDPAKSPAATARALHERRRGLARRIERDLLALGPLKGRLWKAAFRVLLGLAETCAPYRENLRFHALRPLEQVRATLLEVGRRLAARGALEDAAAVFFLEAGEALPAVLRGEAIPPSEARTLHARARERRAAHEEALRRPDPPKFLWDDGTPAPAPARRSAPRGGPGGPLATHDAEGRRVLRGVSVSSGVVTGRARRVERIEDGWSLRKDEILLARAATPSWTPLFFFARGVILDIGGMLSHCAVIAREYGIPCVVGLKTATSEIPDGALVRVDATTGEVTVLGA